MNNSGEFNVTFEGEREEHFNPSFGSVTEVQIPGPQGPQGEPGPQGEAGPIGPQGPAGSDADVTAENIKTALGYTPADQTEVNTLSDDVANLKENGTGTGSNGILYGVCSTAPNAKNKEVSIDGFTLKEGVPILVKFTSSNSIYAPTLNVNGTGAIPMCKSGNTVISAGSDDGWAAGAVILLVYDGTSWVRDYWTNTVATNPSLGGGYAICSTEEAATSKTCALSGYLLTNGGIVTVNFTNAVPANSTLNINTRGAKAIHYRGSAIEDGIISAGDTATFVYDGSVYHLLSTDRPQADLEDLSSYDLVIEANESPGINVQSNDFFVSLGSISEVVNKIKEGKEPNIILHFEGDFDSDVFDSPCFLKPTATFANRGYFTVCFQASTPHPNSNANYGFKLTASSTGISNNNFDIVYVFDCLSEKELAEYKSETSEKFTSIDDQFKLNNIAINKVTSSTNIFNSMIEQSSDTVEDFSYTFTGSEVSVDDGQASTEPFKLIPNMEISQITNALKVTFGGTVLTVLLTLYEETNECVVYGASSILNGEETFVEFVVATKQDNVSRNGYTFPQSGVYVGVYTYTGVTITFASSAPLFTFDGDTTGLESFEMEGLTFCKVTDDVIETAAGVMGQTVTLAMGGQTMAVLIIPEDCIMDSSPYFIGVLFEPESTEPIILIVLQDLSELGVTATRGTYINSAYASYESGYVSSMTGGKGTTNKYVLKDYVQKDELEELTPSIVQAVLAELQGSPVFGVVDAENNITISGNLADGTYTLKYENADGTTTEIGTLVVGQVTPVDSNVFDPATATLNQRWSNSSYAWVEENGYVVSDYIPVSLSTDESNPTMLHFRGGTFAGNANIVFYNSSKGVVQSATASTNGVGMTPATITVDTDENGDYQLQLGYKNNVFDSNWTSGVAYMRVGLQVNASGTAITAADIQGIKMTINELIAD